MQRIMILAAAMFVAAPAAAQNTDYANAETNMTATANTGSPDANAAAPMNGLVTDPAMNGAPTDPAVTGMAQPTATTVPTTVVEADRGGFPWGAVGLIGLVGLLGRRRNRD